MLMHRLPQALNLMHRRFTFSLGKTRKRDAIKMKLYNIVGTIVVVKAHSRSSEADSAGMKNDSDHCLLLRLK